MIRAATAFLDERASKLNPKRVPVTKIDLRLILKIMRE